MSGFPQPHPISCRKRISASVTKDLVARTKTREAKKTHSPENKAGGERKSPQGANSAPEGVHRPNAQGGRLGARSAQGRDEYPARLTTINTKTIPMKIITEGVMGVISHL